MQKSFVCGALGKLNQLLEKERVALKKLDMEQLALIQKQKTALLYVLGQNTTALNQECIDLVEQIRKNNKRNSWLLRYGLKVFGHLRSINRLKQTLTYNPAGHSLNVDGSPRVVNWRL